MDTIASPHFSPTVQIARDLPSPDPTHQARLDAGRACYHAALQYQAMGLHVLQLCQEHHVGVGRKHGQQCTRPGKRPMHTWKAFQTCPATPEEIHNWWQRFPLGNVGIALGQAAGVVRVDVDGLAGARKLQDLSQGEIPATWSFSSGSGGRGILFAWPKDLPCQTTALKENGPHEELRFMGTGSQTVLPPSRHASGNVYAWEPGHSPEEISLAPAPAWLIDQLRADGTTPAKVDAQKPAHPTENFSSFSSKLASNSMGVQTNRITCEFLSHKLTGQDVAALFADWDVVQRCLLFLGFPPDLTPGEMFACPLHPPDHSPSAVMLPPTDDHPSYLFFCHHDTRAVSLPGLFYESINGRGATLPKPSFLVWSVRLLRAAGVLPDTPEGKAPTLWQGASEAVVQVYAAFRELLACRRWTTEQTTPFSWRFAAQWLGPGLAESAIAAAIRWLLSKGFLIKAGEAERTDKRGRKLQLFALGSRLARKLSVSTTPAQTQTQTLADAEARLEAAARADALADLDDINGHGPFCWCEECQILFKAQQRLEEKRRRNGYTALGSLTCPA